MHYKSPLRYPGGKRKLANYIRLVFRVNGLEGGEYVEPYAGGAGVALSVLYHGEASHIHINDVDRSVWAIWHSVLNETEELCERINEVEVTMDEWHRQKGIHEQADEVTTLDLGFATFFLNRTNRSGIITGGVIGGQEQGGKYKIDARFNKEDLIQRIKKLAQYADRITLYNQDAAALLESVVPNLPVNTLVYLDPPYYTKGAGLYSNFYQHPDHEIIARTVTSLRQSWVVTYDNVDSVTELYRDYRYITYSLSYSAAERLSGSEIMFFCENLQTPEVTHPVNIKDRIVAQFQSPLPLQ